MIIPSRAAVDAWCGCRTTLYQRIAGILAPLMLLGSIVYILIIWHTLPEKIPTHFGPSGAADGYGHKSTLVMLVFLAWMLFGVLSAISSVIIQASFLTISSFSGSCT